MVSTYFSAYPTDRDLWVYTVLFGKLFNPNPMGEALERKTFLDISAGEGRAVKDLLRMGKVALGVTPIYPSLGPYRRGYREVPFYIVEGNWHLLLPHIGKWDVVLDVLGILTYTAAKGEALEKMVGLLKEGGMLLAYFHAWKGTESLFRERLKELKQRGKIRRWRVGVSRELGAGALTAYR